MIQSAFIALVLLNVDSKPPKQAPVAVSGLCIRQLRERPYCQFGGPFPGRSSPAYSQSAQCDSHLENKNI